MSILYPSPPNSIASAIKNSQLYGSPNAMQALGQYQPPAQHTSPPYIGTTNITAVDAGSVQRVISELHLYCQRLSDQIAGQGTRIEKLTECVEWLSDNKEHTMADYVKVLQVKAEFDKAIVNKAAET